MRTPRIARVVPALGSAAAAALTLLAAACADAPTGPAAPASAAGPNTAAGAYGASATATTRGGQWLEGTLESTLRAVETGRSEESAASDTTVTLIQVGTDRSLPIAVDLRSALGEVLGTVEFPYAAGSVCDPRTSSYGPGTWDDACEPARRPIRVTAKLFRNAQGRVAVEFEPALRFVPGLARGVTLTLRDAAAPGTRIDYCTANGCVDESQADASLATRLDPANGVVSRRLKHFSGYTVLAE